MTFAPLIVNNDQIKNCPAPAKLNLFLHVTGQRADGYHLLETAFQLIDRCDYLDFSLRLDGQIVRCNDIQGVPAETDLVVRAAQLLKQQTGSNLGADITLHKNLPMGGGLGGGSSDAATTLIALNRLWRTQLSRQQLQQMSVKLGADVPFFIFGKNAFGAGIGEQLTAIDTPKCWYVVIEPGVSVPTASIFSAKSLTRNSHSIKVSDFQRYPNGIWRNDLQAVATQLHPQIANALEYLSQFGRALMTGSGACVFCPCDTEQAADKIIKSVADQQQKLTTWKASALPSHPLSAWLIN